MPFFKRKRFHSKKYVQKKRERRLNRGFAVVFALLLVVAATTVVTRLDAFEIREVIVEGDSVVSERSIQKEVVKELSGAYVLVLHKQSGLVVRRRTLEGRLLSVFPKIKEVEVEVENFNKLIITVQDRKPFALWCRKPVVEEGWEEKQPALQEECFFLDEGGLVFAQAPDFSGSVFFKYYGDVGADNPSGEYFLSEEKFRSLSFFLSSLERLNIRPIEFHKGAESSTLVLESEDFSSGIDGNVIFNTSDNLDVVYDNLSAVIENDALNSDQEKREVEYIDLRFGNKVFYRLKGE